MTASSHPSPKERYERGRSLRERIPRSAHAEWAPAPDRPDPVTLLEEQNEDRLDWLVPVRRGRMAVSPFAFFRGSARIMAADLSATPVTGLTVQTCGDAHLANFGFFASPERRLVFDINDFDETLAGPWEWDIKRLAASFTIAARHIGLSKDKRQQVTERAVRSYRMAMRSFANMRTTDVWYALFDEDAFFSAADDRGRKKQAKDLADAAKKKDSRQALEKLAVEIDGAYRIKSQPPLLVPLRDMQDELPRGKVQEFIEESFASYRETLPDNCKVLLSRFRAVDAALKVVGVGSVGTRAAVLLLEGRDRKDPLFLQIKQATQSVLEEFLPKSPYENHGQRVIEGQRLLQTVSDIFLGWTRGEDGRDYYWRQLRDWKGSADVENVSGRELGYLARMCGWTLARAHARTGDPIAIAGYLGNGDTFDQALSAFARRYAQQNEHDSRAFSDQIDSGHLISAKA